MRVAELIEVLRGFDPIMKVVVVSPNSSVVAGEVAAAEAVYNDCGYMRIRAAGRKVNMVALVPEIKPERVDYE